MNNKKTLHNVLEIVLTVLFAGIVFYLLLPAINLQSKEFYVYLISIAAFYLIVSAFIEKRVPIKVGASVEFDPHRLRERFSKRGRKKDPKVAVPLIVIGALLLVLIVGALSSAVFLRAGAYSKLITTETGDFSADVEVISFDQIPMLDEDSANMLANRKLGELSDLVSQFEVDASSVQINHEGTPVRITYLNYGDFFKWIKNRADGIPGYMLTDMVTQEVKLVRLSEGIHYSPSEHFSHNITRHLRFRYPTLLFKDVNFEIDPEGNPYWIASAVQRKIGLFGGEDVKGTVVVNAVSGECTYYTAGEIPSWVDRVYTASLIIKQYDYYGKYHNGFLNSLFSQKDCTVTTEGYNYIAIGDDVYVYTGITSVGGDESNVGFILVNQRTKEAKYYNIPGAEEFSAMNSAEGAVQQYSYKSTFPILLNIGGEPTYFMSLKDESGLVKMYAMVNVRQYQIVSSANSVSECEKKYENLLRENGIFDEPDEPADDLSEVKGKITEMKSAVIEGTTCFYLRLDSGDKVYRVSVKENENVILLGVGDAVTLKYLPAFAEDAIIPASELVITNE